MNVDKCVALHNKILEHGFLQSGRTIEDLQRERKTWFDNYGDKAEAFHGTLSSDLIAFLERVYVTNENNYSFFYYVSCLYWPEGLFEDAQCLNEADYDESNTRYVALYMMNMFSSSHRTGVVFDQHSHTAIMCETIWDSDTICNGRTAWHPLENILEAWLDMIEKGKIVASPDESERFPWTLVPYSQTILEDTIDAYNRLVEEIESRMPADSPVTIDAGRPLIHHAILDTANPRRGFAYQFARKTTKPRFRFLAPGLEFQPESGTTPQPFASLRYSTEDVYIHPVLLFCATDGATPCTAPPSEHSPFHYRFDNIPYPAGLYFSCTDDCDNVWEDECRLVLPFGVGAKGFARTSDGARFGENTEDAERVEPKDTFWDVYQPGHCPFTIDHPRQLVDVLKNWLGMVQRGDWKVDANGVVGGIDEWKKADSEEEWEKYVIPIKW